MNILRLKEASFEPAYGILCTSSPPKAGLTPHFCRIASNGKTTIHSHEETEVFYIISGFGSMTIDHEVNEVKAGDLIYIPSLAKHELKNIGNEELIFLSVYN